MSSYPTGNMFDTLCSLLKYQSASLKVSRLSKANQAKIRLGEVATSRVGIRVVKITLRARNVWDREGHAVPGGKIWGQTVGMESPNS